MLAASFLQLTKVRDACADFLHARLTPQNVLGIRTFAESLGSLSLVKAADKFLQKHFKSVSESEEFLAVGLAEVTELVGRDELHVVTEEIVFLAVLRWIKQGNTSACWTCWIFPLCRQTPKSGRCTCRPC